MKTVLLALLLSTHIWQMIVAGALVLGALIGVGVLVWAANKAIENEIGRWFGWCVLICLLAVPLFAQVAPAPDSQVDRPQWHYADGTSKYDALASLGCTTADGVLHMSSARTSSGGFVFADIPPGVHVDCWEWPALGLQTTVKIGSAGPQPPQPPVPPTPTPTFTIVYGLELLTQPPLTSPPLDRSIDKVIVGVSPEGANAGKVVWIVVVAQGGLPVPPGFRVVWP
jgi:hypothetical protein